MAIRRQESSVGTLKYEPNLAKINNSQHNSAKVTSCYPLSLSNIS